MGIFRNTRKPSRKLIWLIIPLVVIMVVIGVKKSFWGDGSRNNYYPWVWSSVINTYADSVVKDDVAVMAEGPVVDSGGVVAEGPSENYYGNNSLSYPPLAMEDEMDVQLPVSSP